MTTACSSHGIISSSRRLVLLLLCLAAAGACGGCSSLMFYPMRHHVLVPSDIGLQYEDIDITSPGREKVHSWLLRAEQSRATVLFLHGNAENISTHIAAVHWLPRFGYNVLLPDYRGYGSSGGKPGMPEMHEDAQAAVDYLLSRPDLSRQPLFLLGQSIGAAAALYTAAHPRNRGVFRAVIADSAFSSYRGIARDVFGRTRLFSWLGYPLSLTLSERYSPLSGAARIAPVPLLLIHGTNDAIVPMKHSLLLFAAANEPKELWLAPGAGHIEALQLEEYRRRLLNFLEHHSRSGAANLSPVPSRADKGTLSRER